MRQRKPGEEMRRKHGFWNLGKVLLGGGILNIYYLEVVMEGWMHFGNGLHGGDRKTFWIGGTMVITVST